MRKRGPPGRLAGMSATGMLTRPKVTVPDQMPRGRDADDSFLSGTLPSLRAAEARLERARQRGRRRLPARRRTPRRLPTPGLRLDELLHACLVLVPVFPGLELPLERAHQLLGEAELLRVELFARRRLELCRGDDLVGMAERHEEQPLPAGAQHGYAPLASHHPPDDAVAALRVERGGERRVVGGAARVRREPVWALVPVGTDAAAGHELRDVDVARLLGLELRQLVPGE